MKTQTRKVGVAGGFFNQLMGNNSTEPKVGEGATILMYSDRDPYEVVEVSDNGLSCKIRSMKAEFIGSGYGDERYNLFPNPQGHILELEWNAKKCTWGTVAFSNEIQRSVVNKLIKEHGWGWRNFIPKDVKMKDYKNFSKVSVIFGQADKYRDPSF